MYLCRSFCTDIVILLPVSPCIQIFGFLVTGVYGINTFLAVRRWRRGSGCQGAAQTSEYIRARTASRGEMEARPELAWALTDNQRDSEKSTLPAAGRDGHYSALKTVFHSSGTAMHMFHNTSAVLCARTAWHGFISLPQMRSAALFIHSCSRWNTKSEKDGTEPKENLHMFMWRMTSSKSH